MMNVMVSEGKGSSTKVQGRDLGRGKGDDDFYTDFPVRQCLVAGELTPTIEIVLRG
jgi:hypothetical protein